MTALMRRLDDRLNPVLVKEVYQGVRGREFLTTSWAVLVLSLVGYALAVANAGTSDGVHQALLLSLFFLCGIYTLVIIPQATGNQLRNDITSGTLDLIVLTRVSPWSIVSGRLQIATLRILLVLAYASPFLVAAVLLGGVTWSSVMMRGGVLLLAGLCASALVLMINSLVALSPHFANVARLAQVAFVFLALPLVFNVFGAVMVGSRTFFPLWGGSTYLYLGGLLWTLAAAAALLAFCGLFAAAALTPEGVRSFFRAKIAFAFLYLLFCAPWGLLALGRGAAIAAIAGRTLAFPTLPVFALFVFAALSSADWMGSRRRRRGGLFGDGILATTLYFSLLVLIVSAATAVAHGDLGFLLHGWYWISYFVFCVGVATWLRGDAATRVYFLALAALVAAGAVAAFLFALFAVASNHPLRVFFPPLAGAVTTDAVWTLLPLGLGAFAVWRVRTSGEA